MDDRVGGRVLGSEASGRQRRLEDLWDRRTGGRDVAASPEKSNFEWPKGPRPAGLEEALQWFSSAIEEEEPVFLFLVGGPGAGKSDAAAELVADLDEIDPPTDGLAHRKYRFKTGSGRTLLLINDATISPTHDAGAAFVEDIALALGRGDHLLACVNRGVLVEAIRSIPKSTMERSTSDAAAIWLHEGRSDRLPDGVQSKIHLVANEEYISFVQLEGDDGASVLACAVFTDACSLFERRPVTLISQSQTSAVAIKAEKYEIMLFSSRSARDISSTPGDFLLDEVLGVVVGEIDRETAAWDPVQANLLSLSRPETRRALVDAFRAAEIFSGKRMTYRELWGAIVRSILGSIPAHSPREELRKIRASWCAEHQSGDTSFRKMRETAEHRFSQSLFGDTKVDQDIDAVSALLRKVDPCRDAMSGRLADPTSEGWSDPISEAFEAATIGESPLANLLKALQPQDGFHSAVTPFEKNLDDAYVLASKSRDISAREKKNNLSWYARYLTRLYAISNGVTAFNRVVRIWTEIWTLSSVLPPEIKSSLMTLIRPPRRPEDSHSTMLIPLYDSRVEPVRGYSPAAKLVMSTSDLKLVSQARGEGLYLKLMSSIDEVTSVPLDSALLREALATGAARSGATDVSNETMPRLERVRSAYLRPNNEEAKSYFIVKGDSEWQLKVP